MDQDTSSKDPPAAAVEDNGGLDKEVTTDEKEGRVSQGSMEESFPKETKSSTEIQNEPKDTPMETEEAQTDDETPVVEGEKGNLRGPKEITKEVAPKDSAGAEKTSEEIIKEVEEISKDGNEEPQKATEETPMEAEGDTARSEESSKEAEEENFPKETDDLQKSDEDELEEIDQTPNNEIEPSIEGEINKESAAVPKKSSFSVPKEGEEISKGGDTSAAKEAKKGDSKNSEGSSEVDGSKKKDKESEAETMEVDEEVIPLDEGKKKKKKNSGDGPVIEISSVSGGVEVEDITSSENEKSANEGNDSTIQISTVASLEGSNQDGDAVEILEESSSSKTKSVENENSDSNSSATGEKKKSGIKLASFAGLGRNGIADQTPMSSSVKISGCSKCSKEIGAIFNAIVWETMQFCDEKCLGEYQNRFNSCASCKKAVQTASMGKYCVRFGSDIKQFCSNICLEDYKKGLKVCCYCQKDISGGEGFLAPIGDKGQFKDFCEQNCLKQYEVMHLGKHKFKETLACAVCLEEKIVEVELVLSDETVKLCGHPCFSAYQFANKIESSRCDLCEKPYDVKTSNQVIYYDGLSKHFCSVACQNVYVMKYRKIVACHWCKVKKYNFDMIEKWTGSELGASSLYCSINCLNLHVHAAKMQAAANNSATATAGAVSAASPGTANWNGKRAGAPAVAAAAAAAAAANAPIIRTQSMPVIQSVSSLAGAGEPPALPDRLPTEPVPASQLPVSIQTQTIKETIKETLIKCPEDVEVKNKGTLTKPYMQTKGVSCRPHPCHKSCQTEGPTTPTLVPIVVPMWMPLPLHMYERPYPLPVPIPIPVPVPIFIPTTRNSSKGILKQIKKIQSKLPADPFEAELLAMAGALAEKKVESEPDSDDSVSDMMDSMMDDGLLESQPVQQDQQQQPQVPTEDLENEISPDKVVPKPLPVPQIEPSQQVPGYIGMPYSSSNRGRRGPFLGQKRRASTEADEEDPGWQTQEYERNPRRQSRQSRQGRGNRVKQPRLDNSTSREANAGATPSVTNQPPKERPDAKHHLKFTYGVNAWKHWVVQKNAELEKGRAQGKYIKSFETDLLKLRADELNFTLCMFVKEVKKPNGDSYAPDSVLYLAFGIQEYLFENGRIDNIFTDQYYEPFTSALHEVVKDFKLPVNELGYFVTRIEEEHLWEAKQLGAHSPQVLLNTLIYFNTKYFMLKTCEDHTKLSFSHIMKHWKKTVTSGKTNQQRTVLLRYYPPSVKGQRQEEKKCYEQHENLENPLRCPVKLYEFYISKCPESTKSRNDVFYLQPERSCVPDSPVWYSNAALNQFQLDKMLQRLLMVREVQEHMLADAS